MPFTRSRPATLQREKIFGFLLSHELMKNRSDYVEMMADCPHAGGEEREDYELETSLACMIALSINIMHLWGKATFDSTPSGPIIGLVNNKQSTTMPPPELIERMKEFLELDVEPEWVDA